MKNLNFVFLLGLVSLIVSGCAGTPLTASLPTSPAAKPLDMKYVKTTSADPTDKPMSQSDYRKALTRSSGFIENFRAMLITAPYTQLVLEEDFKEQARKEGWSDEILREKVAEKLSERLKSPTCFKFEFDTRSSDASNPKYWELKLSSKDEDIPATMKFDSFYISNSNNSSYQFTGDICADRKIDDLQGLTLTLLPRFRKEPKPIVLKWE